MDNKGKVLKFIEGERFVYVVREEKEEKEEKEQKEQNCKKHKISNLKSGAFIVTCFHEVFDEEIIRQEIRGRMAKLKID